MKSRVALVLTFVAMFWDVLIFPAIDFCLHLAGIPHPWP